MARFTRFHCPHLPPTTGGTVALDESESHHLSRVLRLSVGDPVELFDGLGSRAQAVVLTISKHETLCELTDTPTISPKPRDIGIAFAPPKRDFDDVITMLAELGIPRLHLLVTDHGEVLTPKHTPRAEKLTARISKLLVAAAKQSGNDWLMHVHCPATLDTLPVPVVVCDPSARDPITSVASHSSSLTLAIGPEGGWSPHERQLFAERSWPLVTLPGHVLRTGTAAVVAAALAASCDTPPQS